MIFKFLKDKINTNEIATSQSLLNNLQALLSGQFQYSLTITPPNEFLWFYGLNKSVDIQIYKENEFTILLSPIDPYLISDIILLFNKNAKYNFIFDLIGENGSKILTWDMKGCLITSIQTMFLEEPMAEITFFPDHWITSKN